MVMGCVAWKVVDVGRLKRRDEFVLGVVSRGMCLKVPSPLLFNIKHDIAGEVQLSLPIQTNSTKRRNHVLSTLDVQFNNGKLPLPSNILWTFGEKEEA